MLYLLESANDLLEVLLVILLLSAGAWLTLRLGFIQLRRFGHGVAVVAGRHDDPSAAGEVTHFEALTTALSATVGIGNIAGVAIAIHWGGPGAVFWMWVTAFLGMATKFAEVTLAQRFRVTDAGGQVSGGPMHYIERGLGPKWRPVALFFAAALVTMAMVSGNAIQANTLADLAESTFGVPTWAAGLVSAGLVGAVIVGGIGRIGKVTAVLAPTMAALYVVGGLAVLALNAGMILPSLSSIVTEAFDPTAGVAGTGAGVFLQTMLWGVRRGLFSNEAGQGSAPIAHSAAKTDEPVKEGVVALLEPFIDTIVICTITALAILCTGVWKDTTPTEIALRGGDATHVLVDGAGRQTAAVAPARYVIADGYFAGVRRLAWHEVPLARLYVDAAFAKTFDGEIDVAGGTAVGSDGRRYGRLYAAAVENAAPLTMWAYRRGLGNWGGYIVLVCVILFAVSTAISWSYYGDRCATYLFGERAVLPYRLLYVGMHFLGAVLGLNVVWELGDLAMALGTIPNVVALLALSGVVAREARRYFGRRT